MEAWTENLQKYRTVCVIEDTVKTFHRGNEIKENIQEQLLVCTPHVLLRVFVKSNRILIVENCHIVHNEPEILQKS